MKLLIKRIYCSTCRRLVRGHEQKSNGTTNILCSRCGKLLQVWNGLTWRSAK